MTTVCLTVALWTLLTASPPAQPPLSGAVRAGSVPGSVPSNVASIIRRHCSGCHHADSVLDLRELPGAGDTETWNDVLQAVQSGRMPLSLEEAGEEWIGPEPKPPPLSPALRQELIGAITGMLEAAQPAEPLRTQLQLPQGEWLLIVREVALPFMTEEALGALIAPRRDLAVEAQSHLVAADVCTRIIDIDLGRPADDRRLLRGAPQPESMSPSHTVVEGLVRRMHSLVYQQEPTAAEVEQGGARFRRFLGVAGSTQEAVVALCTSYLAGARVRQLEFAGPLPRR
jgi:hypothetical protein